MIRINESKKYDFHDKLRVILWSKMVYFFAMIPSPFRVGFDVLNILYRRLPSVAPPPPNNIIIIIFKMMRLHKNK